jgi:hypothetical protein
MSIPDNLANSKARKLTQKSLKQWKQVPEIDFIYILQGKKCVCAAAFTCFLSRGCDITTYSKTGSMNLCQVCCLLVKEISEVILQETCTEFIYAFTQLCPLLIKILL